jgi:ABC-type dipeptide/oligopeptide/nickel transport system permease component
MLQFTIRRLGSTAFVLFSLTFLTFLVAHLAPGNPVLQMMGNRRDPARYAELMRQYGLDQPLPVQYVNYLGGLLHGDLGMSYQFPGRSVAAILGTGLPVSLRLGLGALLLSTVVGVTLGILAALRRNGWLDRMIMVVMLGLYSIPSFVLIALLVWLNILLYHAGLPALPVAGLGSPASWVLPIFVLAASSMGYTTRLTRSSLLEVLGQDYIRTARAKGLTQRVIVAVHALRNAVLPLLTVLGPSVAFLVTGAFVVEKLFNLPGVGYITIQSIGQRDYPVIQATTILLGLAVVVMNLITDFLYTVFDPRIRADSGR